MVHFRLKELRSAWIGVVAMSVLTAGVVFTGGDESSHAESPAHEETKGEAKKEDPTSRAPSATQEEFKESKFGAESKDQKGADSKVSLPGPKAVEEFKKQREALDEQLKALAARESELAARERAVEDELKKLKEIRDSVSKVEGDKKQVSEGKVTKIIETLETMAPKSAAPLLASIDEDLAVAAMARMATPKLAKIMNLIEANKASRLTELMAGVAKARTGGASSAPARVPAKATGTTSLKGEPEVPSGSSSGSVDKQKGGEKQNDANNEKSKSSGLPKSTESSESKPIAAS